MPGAMGAAPVTFGEIQAWQQQTGNELMPWEVLLLRRMSSAYVAEASEATRRDRPAPWLPEAEVRRQRGLDRRIRSLFRD
jgi:hypothetical protein